jgi:hypothetical protein
LGGFETDGGTVKLALEGVNEVEIAYAEVSEIEMVDKIEIPEVKEIVVVESATTTLPKSDNNVQPLPFPKDDKQKAMGEIFDKRLIGLILAAFLVLFLIVYSIIRRRK